MLTVLFILLKWSIGSLLLWRVPRCRGAAREGSPSEKISVIIPARNEEGNLPGLLRSLSRQSMSPQEILVVDDDSTDATARVAREWGARVIPSGCVPAGWTGKSWACWRGARVAEGERFLFLDADATLAPEALAALSREYARQPGGIFTLYPYHATGNNRERLSAFFNIISMMSLGIATILGLRVKPMGAYGACILCSREEYFRCGGHKAVMGEIMEDVALGRLFQRHGLSVRCLGGKGTVGFRMYPDGLAQMVEGWSKNFASGATASHPLLLFLVVVWVFGAVESVHLLVSALIRPDASPPAVAVLVYGAFVLQIFLMLRQIGNFGFRTALFFPLALLFFILVFFLLPGHHFSLPQGSLARKTDRAGHER